jgi:peptidoglycan hydrolase CwlO-like protein
MSAASNRYNENKRRKALEALREQPGLTKEVADLNAQIATLIKVVQDRDGKIAELEALTISHETRIRKLEADNAKMMAFIAEQ